MDYMAGQPNLEDEFKTSEHNSFHEQPVTVEVQDEDDTNTNTIKGTPSTIDPLNPNSFKGQEDGVMSEIRRDPQEEYFKLAILSLKMIHTEKEEAEYIYEIKPEKLYQ